MKTPKTKGGLHHCQPKYTIGTDPQELGLIIASLFENKNFIHLKRIQINGFTSQQWSGCDVIALLHDKMCITSVHSIVVVFCKFCCQQSLTTSSPRQFHAAVVRLLLLRHVTVSLTLDNNYQCSQVATSSYLPAGDHYQHV